MTTLINPRLIIQQLSKAEPYEETNLKLWEGIILRENYSTKFLWRAVYKMSNTNVAILNNNYKYENYT